MEINTYICIKNENPKRVKEDVNNISTMIAMNNYNSFPFIEITEIVSYTSGLGNEQKTKFKESKIFININEITSYRKV